MNFIGIYRFESNKRIINIHSVDKEIGKCYTKSDEIEEKLFDKHRKFIRVNQSVIIKQMYVKTWTFEYIEIINGERFSISIISYIQFCTKDAYKRP